MAKNLNSNEAETVNENHEPENDINLTNTSDLNNKSFLELNMEHFINPEDISKVVRSQKFSRAPKQIANLEITEPTISNPSYEISNVNTVVTSFDQSVTNSLTIIPEVNISDSDYDADSSEQNIVEDKYSEQEPHGQESEDHSDLEDSMKIESVKGTIKGLSIKN